MSAAFVVTVRLTPRADRDSIDRVGTDGVVHARVTAPPVDGAANRALVKLVSAELAVPRSAVTLMGSATSRLKRVRIAGVTHRQLEEYWPGAVVGGSRSA